MQIADPLLGEFVVESMSRLEEAEQCFLGIERGDAAAIAKAFRALHTVKGNASFFDLPSISTLAHHVESVLDGIRAGTLVADAPRMELLLRGVDRLQALLRELPQVDGDVEELVAIAKRLARPDALARPEAACGPLAGAMPPSAPLMRGRLMLGEWLVASKALSAEVVLEALIEQQRRTQLPLEILRDAGLSAVLAMRAVAEAENENLHPFAVAARHGWLPDGDAMRLLASQRATRPPLGKMLIERGSIDSPRMLRLLNDFFSNTPIQEAAAHADASPWLPLGSSMQLSSDAAESFRVMTNQAMEQCGHALGCAKPTSEIIDMLSTAMQSLREALTVVRATACLDVLAICEQVIAAGRVASHQPGQAQPAAAQAWIDLLIDGLGMVWEIRASILRCGDEQPMVERLGQRLAAWRGRCVAICEATLIPSTPR